MRSITSLHWPNQGYEDAIADALTIARGGIVMLDMALPHWYGELRKLRGPEYLIGVRLYPEAGNEHWAGRHWHECDPAGWAEECARRLAAVPGVLDDAFICVSPANEQDLAVEGHPEAASPGHNNVAENVYDSIWAWQYVWLVTMRRLLPHAKIKYGTAPLAGGHEPPGSQPDSEYQLAGFAILADEADCLWDHGYCLPDGTGSKPADGGYWHGIRSLRPRGFDNPNDLGGLLTQYPDKTIIRSEFGTFRHSDLSAVGVTLGQYHNAYSALSGSGRYALVAPFIWHSGDEHWPNRIKDNSALVAGLKALDYPAAAWPPENMPEVPTMPEYTLGFKTYHDQHPEIGAAVSDLMYDANGTAVQYTEHGMLHWVKSANAIYFFPKKA